MRAGTKYSIKQLLKLLKDWDEKKLRDEQMFLAELANLLQLVKTNLFFEKEWAKSQLKDEEEKETD